MFLWVRKLQKKEGPEANYITAFKTLCLGLFICQRQTILKIEFWKLSSRLSIFSICQS